MSRPADKATAAGLAALLIWSASVALMRGVSENMGLLTGPALASFIGGVLALAWTRLRGGSVSAMLRLPPKYLYGCGALFVSCNVGLYLAVGACLDRPQTLVVALVNYLWPALTVALSVPILGRRAKAWLPGACLIAAAGTAVALLGGERLNLAFWATGRGLFALAMGLVAAVSWGLYSNLARLWGDPEQGAVPLFALATAAALGLLLLLRPESPRWSLRAVLEVATLGVASLMAAYALWDLGMRRGDQALLGVCSYFVPVASTIVSALYLGVRPGWHVLAGCALVAAGALLSSRALKT
ncbi:MAG: EamA family transporter [Elusimicrobia bacterium]|nr:EamA family transporter [Elusimicrobiota bacterium]